MLHHQVAQLEAKAAQAEAELAKLRSACGGNCTSNDDDTTRRLVELKSLLEGDRKEAEEVRAKRDELLEENARLKKQIEKDEYRIMHLIRALEQKDAGH